MLLATHSRLRTPAVCRPPGRHWSSTHCHIQCPRSRSSTSPLSPRGRHAPHCCSVGGLRSHIVLEERGEGGREGGEKGGREGGGREGGREGEGREGGRGGREGGRGGREGGEGGREETKLIKITLPPSTKLTCVTYDRGILKMPTVVYILVGAVYQPHL